MLEYISKLDSHHFGFPVAKFSNNIENPELLVKMLKEVSTKLIIARIDFSNMKLINQLEKIGFIYKDAQVTFNYPIHKNIPENNFKHFSIVPFNINFLSEIVEITKTSFNNYGHYFADNNLDRKKCIQIYTDWIKRCCERKEIADEIIVAEKDNVAIGYLAIKKHFLNNDNYVAGVIGAVAPEFRKLGVFSAINIESLHLAKKMEASRIENNVLITNLPVIKTYTSLGYDIIRSEITLHYWYE
jgi:hypothetical protein